MGARGLETLFQSSLEMETQSSPSQLAANNRHHATASKASARDIKRKHQSFSTQLESSSEQLGKGFSAGDSGGGGRKQKQRRSLLPKGLFVTGRRVVPAGSSRGSALTLAPGWAREQDLCLASDASVLWHQ